MEKENHIKIISRNMLTETKKQRINNQYYLKNEEVNREPTINTIYLQIKQIINEINKEKNALIKTNL